ncbi:MAG: hypothetical protein JWR89_4018 [Tardiphaga sp.]|nr:hypothetical protein [Tardiphaga sp.]
MEAANAASSPRTRGPITSVSLWRQSECGWAATEGPEAMGPRSARAEGALGGDDIGRTSVT